MIMDAVDSYLSLRRLAGYELEVPEYLLRHFARYAAQQGQCHIVAQTVIEWASQAPSSNQRTRRLDTVIRFARHAQVEDGGHEVPPKGVFGGRIKRRPPYIYSQQNLNDLLLAAAKLHPVNSIRPHSYQTLFALMLCTGLRISEALALTCDDITPDGLLIRKTKFKKSRLVPLHPTTRVAIEKYLLCRQHFTTTCPSLFVSLYGKGLACNSVEWTFRRILKDIGLYPAPDGRRPRLHDLRHSFACRSLEASSEDRDNIGRHLVALSTYLGHTHVSDTYWYLESTPVLMQDISSACQSFWQGDDS